MDAFSSAAPLNSSITISVCVCIPGSQERNYHQLIHTVNQREKSLDTVCKWYMRRCLPCRGHSQRSANANEQKNLGTAFQARTVIYFRCERMADCVPLKPSTFSPIWLPLWEFSRAHNRHSLRSTNIVKEPIRAECLTESASAHLPPTKNK